MRAVLDGVVLAGAQNPIFPALVAAESKSEVLGPGRNHAISKHTWYLKWGADVTQGEAVIETAPDPNYQGAWTALHTIPFVAAGAASMRSYDGMLSSTRVRLTQASDGVGVEVSFSGHRG